MHNCGFSLPLNPLTRVLLVTTALSYANRVLLRAGLLCGTEGVFINCFLQDKNKKLNEQLLKKPEDNIISPGSRERLHKLLFMKNISIIMDQYAKKKLRSQFLCHIKISLVYTNIIYV